MPRTTAFSMMLICILMLMLGACVRNPRQPEPLLMPGTASMLQQGKRLFQQAYYKRAMKDLLPLACDCIAEAEYAVGYMHYYGYGVPQDQDMGAFWIRRAAEHGYQPAKSALQIITDTYHDAN